MKTAAFEHPTIQKRGDIAIVGPLFMLAIVSAVLMAVLSVFPTTAWAAEGDIIGYVYLDPDEHGENTALVVQDTGVPTQR